MENNLLECRKKAGMRQKDVASKLELDCVDRISRWENGLAYPNVINLFKLAEIYNVTTEELYRKQKTNYQ